MCLLWDKWGHVTYPDDCNVCPNMTISARMMVKVSRKFNQPKCNFFSHIGSLSEHISWYVVSFKKAPNHVTVIVFIP